jgi:DNA polymerase-1
VDPLSLFDADLTPLAPVEPATSPRVVPVAPPPLPPAPPAGPRLLAVDGNSLAHRAFHAYGAIGLADDSGGDRSGVYGFLALLTAIAERVGPEAVVIGFDCRESSVRRTRHPEYKANRSEKDPALYALLDLVPALCADLGVTVVSEPGWEADDVVGSAAAAAETVGWTCTVATSDRDAFGLISDATTVLRLRSGLDNAVEMTPARLRREVGVAPHQYVEFAAQRGDTSDNLPGVNGIGPARAAALLAAFPSVAEAVADPIGCRSVLGPGPGQVLIDDLAEPAASIFLRNVELMTIRRDVEVDVAAARRSTRPQQLAARLDHWGLSSLAGRVAVGLGVRPDLPPPPDDADLPF